MKVPIKLKVSACLVPLVLLLSGCSASGTGARNAASSNPAQSASTVSIERRQIVPTFSTKATVEQATTFTISTSQRGAFKPVVKVNDSVKAGQVLAWNNGKEIKAPVDVIVRRVAEASVDFPAHYPVFELEYQGFAVAVEASNLLSVAPLESLTGKFQIQGGLGPTQIAAVVAAPGTHETAGGELNAVSPDSINSQGSQDLSDNMATPGALSSPENLRPESTPRVSSQNLLCLIGKDQPVRPGQVATVVLTGKAKTAVLAAPVNAVAGRISKGSVTLVKDGRSFPTEVGLGVSDGAYIEITSGLNEGDVIRAVAPYLDPRKK